VHHRRSLALRTALAKIVNGHLDSRIDDLLQWA
jgi:hypothetical protein